MKADFTNLTASGVSIPAPILPHTNIDKYPTHLASYGKGGLRTVQDKDDLDRIPNARKELGMWVYVINDPDGTHNYQLQNIDIFTERTRQVPKYDDEGNYAVDEEGNRIYETIVEKVLQSREIKWVPINLNGGG